MTFATTFYDALLDGRRFIDAVADARDRRACTGGNTWARLPVLRRSGLVIPSRRCRCTARHALTGG